MSLRGGTAIRTNTSSRATVERTVTGADGRQTVLTSPRLNARDELLRVRAFYLDIAQWATEEPARWAQWAVPCPVSDTEISRARDLKRRKARMDQRIESGSEVH
jgi:hypothetical protein